MKRDFTLEDVAGLITHMGDDLARKLGQQMYEVSTEVRADIASFRMEVIPRLDGIDTEIQAIHSDLDEIYNRLDGLEANTA